MGDLLILANGLVLILLVNVLASRYFFRFDLTEEKRYSIKDQTRDLLSKLDDNVYVEVYLAGEINAEFRRFQKAIRETLEEFRVHSDNRVFYSFVDPASAASQKARSEFMASLAARGIQPTNVIDTKDGKRVEKIIFPGAIVSYRGVETPVMLLKGNRASFINQSIEDIEFEMAMAIHKLTVADPPHIGVVTGHGELDSLQVASFMAALAEMYYVSEVTLQEQPDQRYDALVIAKPTRSFSQAEKYRLDQYIMHGGKALFLIDKLDANMDSTSNPDYVAFPYDLNLDDLLFRYGVRINADLVQDLHAAKHPVITGQVGNKPVIHVLEWPFFPLINRFADHPVTRNLDAVVTRFVSSIDTVKATGVKKTPLMFTSQYSRISGAPAYVSVNRLRENLSAETFTKSFIPIGYLLEGTFTSLFRNRFPPEGVEQKDFREQSVPTRIIVVADGDIAANAINQRTGRAQPLGWDPPTQYTFANQDLLMNMVAYLTDENGLIRVRNKEVKIRPLDRERIIKEKTKWQALNLALPVVGLTLFGVVRAYFRKRKYARF